MLKKGIFHIIKQFPFRKKNTRSSAFALLLVYCLFNSFSCFAQINTQRLLENGRMALHFDDYVLAIQYFNKHIAMKPQKAEPYYYRAIAKIQLEDFTGAIEDCNKALDRNPFLHTALYARGFAYKQLQQYDKALIDLTQAIHLGPDNDYYKIHYIEVCEATEDYTTALNEINKLLRKKKSPLTNELWAEKAQLMLLQKDTIKATAIIDSALTFYPKNANLIGYKALFCILNKQDSIALSLYNQAIALGNNQPNTFLNRGLLNYRAKNYQQALNDYDKAVSLDSTNTQTLFNRALLRSEVGDWNNAFSDLCRLLDLDAENYEARYQRAIVANEIGEYDVAKNDFSKILEKYPDFPPAYYARAIIYDKIGDKKKAQQDRYLALKIEDDYISGRKSRKNYPVIDTKADFENHSALKKHLSFTQEKNNPYNDQTRGLIQNIRVQPLPRECFALSFYTTSDNIRNAKENYSPVVFEMNGQLNEQLIINNREITIAYNSAIAERHATAIESLSKRIDSNEKNSEKLYLLRGLHYYTIGLYDNAEKDFEKVINCNGKLTAVGYFAKGMNAYKANPNTNNIVDDFKKAYETDNRFAHAIYNAATILYLSDNIDDAIKLFSLAIESDDKIAEAYFNRALCFLAINDNEKAINDLSKAGELGIYQAYALIKTYKDK